MEGEQAPLRESRISSGGGFNKVSDSRFTLPLCSAASENTVCSVDVSDLMVGLALEQDCKQAVRGNSCGLLHFSS